MPCTGTPTLVVAALVPPGTVAGAAAPRRRAAAARTEATEASTSDTTAAAASANGSKGCGGRSTIERGDREANPPAPFEIPPSTSVRGCGGRALAAAGGVQRAAGRPDARCPRDKRPPGRQRAAPSYTAASRGPTPAGGTRRLEVERPVRCTALGHACGRWADGQLGRSTRITARARVGPRAGEGRRRREPQPLAQSAGRDRRAGHSTSNRSACRRGCPERERRRGVVGEELLDERQRIRPRHGGRDVSSCSSPSTSRRSTPCVEIARSSWVTSTRCASAVRPALRVVTRRSTGPNFADAEEWPRTSRAGRTGRRAPARTAHAATIPAHRTPDLPVLISVASYRPSPSARTSVSNPRSPMATPCPAPSRPGNRVRVRRAP